MGLPPTSSKFSGDASNVTTFFYDFPNFTGSHTGVTATMGVNSVAGGGTGLATLTANNVILGNGTSSPLFVAPGTSGNVLSSNGTTWLSTTPVGNSVFVSYASSQVTTQSSSITSTSFVTCSNSPAFTFTPTLTGTYKVYCNIPSQTSSSTSVAVGRIFNTSGGGTLLYESQCNSDSASAALASGMYVQSEYSLTAGVTYVFDIQLKDLGASGVANRGDSSPFYMFAEGIGLGAGSFTTVGTYDSQSPVANGLQIIADVLYAQSATTSFPGMVNTTTQSLAGVKTFTSAPTFSSLSTAGVLLNSAAGVVSSSAGPLAIANGGTNNGSLPVTAGGTLYTDGSAIQNVGAGTAGYVLTSNGASPPTWQASGGGGGTVTTAVFSNQQTSGTSGGSVTSGSFVQTPLNTTETSQSWASLSANQITLTSGTYLFNVTSPSFLSSHFQTQLNNVTDSTIPIIGSSEYSGTGSAQTSSYINGIVVLTGTKTFEIDMQVSVTSTFGFGVPASFGTEVYCRVTISKLA